MRGAALPRDVHEPTVTRVARFCVECVPPEARAELRVEHSVRGNAITIVERRPPWSELVGPEWTSMTVARLRYDPSERTWTLYCADRNERRWPYDFVQPSGNIEDLLAAVDEDPTGIFWG